MLNDVINKVLYGQSSYGLEILINSNNSITYHLVKTEIRKSELDITEKIKGEGVESLTEQEWNKDLPVYISIRGKGILQKKVSKNEGDEAYGLIRKALPNAKVDEFYHQINDLDATSAWVGLVRKATLDELLSSIESLGVHIVGIELGYVALGKLSSIIDKDEFQIQDQHIQINDGLLVDVSSSPEVKNERLNLGGIQIESKFLVAFAASLNFHGFEHNSINHPSIQLEKEEYKQHKLFKLGVKSALAFFLILLLANFFIFQNYNQQHAQLSGELAINSSLLDKLTNLRNEFDRNELFFKSTDLISSSKSSFYADQLAASKPDGIFWNKLDLNPALKKIKKNEDVGFQIGRINIEGVTQKSALLNNWIDILKNKDWIKSIDIKDYRELENRRGGSFFIQIQLK